MRRIDPRSWIIFFGCLALYYIVYARYYTSFEIVHCCDTHGMWTVEYLALHSIARSGEFAWWDPTGVNGWPIYSNLLNWTFNYFSPYSLPYLAGFWLLTRFHDITPQGINQALVYEKVLYYYIVNFIAVLLISREVLRTWAARAFVAIAFTLGVIQFQGFRDSHQYMALAGPLFYVWGLLYYDRRRTPEAFLVFILVTALMAASLSYAYTQSALYWTVALTVFVVVFRPTLVTVSLGHIRAGWGTRIGKLCLLLGLAAFVLGTAAPLSSVALNLGRLTRVSGSRPLDWSHGTLGDWDPPYFGVPAYELWSNVAYFAARSEIHDVLFNFNPYPGSGIDHRYVGLAVLPLAFAGLILGYRRRYFGPIFLSFIVCVVFIPYTVNNLAYLSLMKLPAFQNVRTVGGLLPRDGPALFLILLAAIGLDQLLMKTRIRAGTAPGDARWRGWILAGTLVGLGSAAAALIALGGALSAATVHKPWLAGPRSVAIYTGFFLGIFSVVVLLLLVTRNRRGAQILSSMLLAVVIVDLILAGSHYFSQRPGMNNMAFKNEGYWSKPAPEEIGPITDESQSWAGKGYRGILHNLAGGPWVGLREWLILENRPAMAPLLENWNRDTKFMRAYPHFRFHTAGRFIPYETIRHIDGTPVPKAPGQWVYVHDKELAESAPETAKPVAAKWTIEEFSLNRVRTKVSMPQSGVMAYFDNYDPWWKAYVDGERVPVYRANFTFKAIALGAGEHVVEWRFDPWPVKLAWWLFYLALGLYAFFMWRWMRWTRR